MQCRRFLPLLLLVFPATAQPLPPRLMALEDQWRREFLAAIEQQPSVTEVGEEARQYVAALGKRLAYAAPEQAGDRYLFVLYDDKAGLRVPWFGVLNATNRVNALPGGVVAVPVSLFAVSRNEAEFSAAIARGIAHVSLKHFMRTVLRSAQTGVPTQFGSTLSFSRSLEWAADGAAVTILARAGCDPDALVRHIQNGLASFDTSDLRVQAVQVAISQIASGTYCPGDSLQFRALQARVGQAAEKL